MTTARNSRVLWVIPLLTAIFSLSFPAYAQYGGGTGEPNDPYLIYTAEQMNEIGLHQEDWGKHFKLMADIDLGSFTGTSYNIIGSEWDSPFTGVFNGNNKIISNFCHSSLGSNCVGIFGYINDPNAKVKDLGLIDPEVNNGSGWHTGSLVGLVDSGTITNCYAKGGSVSGYDRVGGLVGWSSGSTITNCYAITSVSGNEDIGGLTGGAGIITNCYATSDVSGYENVGGLVGSNFRMIINCHSMSSVSGNKNVGGLVGINHTIITSCYSMSSVSGQEDVGGLVGTNSMGTITNCYSSASATGTDFVGGLVGEGFQCTITNCYSIGQVEGLSNVGGLVGYIFADEVSASFWDTQSSRQTISAGGTGLTTAEMQLESTFTNAGWDFVGASDGPSDIWAEPEGGGYPILCRQLSPLPALPVFSGGIGTADEPYLISTLNELNSIGYNPRLMDAHFKLINDIDLTGVDFFTMGAIRYPFTGAFDGNGKKISNLGGTQGLFEYVKGEYAYIKDLGLIDPNIDAEGVNGVGSLVGALRNGTIINCYTQGGSIMGQSTIGGLVGRNSSSIVNCYSSASVSGNSTIGGLVGRNNSSIVSCYSSASVSGAYRIGGLVGFNAEGTIINCYAKGSGSVSYMIVGGLVGQNHAGTIKNCYSVGHVQGPSYVGGLIGSESQNGTVITSFWDTQTSGQATSAGGLPSTGGIPLQTYLMQTASIFLTVGWDFVDEIANGTEDIWKISEGLDYPRLWWEKYGGGTGEPNNPYLIYTAEQLNAIGSEPNDWDKHFKLTANIDLAGYTYDRAVIAPDTGGDGYTFPGPSFTGVFDGNGHAVSHLTITGKSYLGLFGQLGSGAEVKDLGVVDINITGSYYAIGGLVGNSFRGNITTSYSTGTVTGYNYVGGLVGYNKYGDIATSYSTAAVSATFSGNQKIGGLVGVNAGRTTTSYSTGTVRGERVVGGLAGHTTGSVTMCYSTGMVSGDQDVGGLLGDRHPEYGIVTGCFWDVETSGQSSSAGGTGKTTAEMQTTSTFLEAGWDFVDETANGTEDIWWILEGQDYPRLWWERTRVAQHICEIEISKTIYYQNHPHGYIIDVAVMARDCVVSVNVLSPNLSSYSLSYEGDGEFCTQIPFSSAEDLAAFPAGDWVFTISYIDGESDTTIVHYAQPDGSSIPLITQEPRIISPEADQTDVPVQAVFVWEPVNDRNATGIGLGWEPIDRLDEEQWTNLPTTETFYGPVSLSPNTTYELLVSFGQDYNGFNLDGVRYAIDADSEQVCLFHTGNE